MIISAQSVHPNVYRMKKNIKNQTSTVIFCSLKSMFYFVTQVFVRVALDVHEKMGQRQLAAPPRRQYIYPRHTRIIYYRSGSIGL